MANTDFKIDLTKSFDHLPKAPIVEAVIEIRTRAESVWEESVVTQRLKSTLPEYPNVVSMNAMQQEFTFGPKVAPLAATHDLGWDGLRFQSADGLHVAQFKRDGFVFSRLAPYDTWETLEKEAKRLWGLHVEIAGPTEVQRLGVRFVNRIPMSAQETRFEAYIEPHPQTPRGLDLPFLNFLHRETLIVPGYDYGINLTRTLQIPQDRRAAGIEILLDIDVFTTQRFMLDHADLERRLTEMRWLKNQSFFGSITTEALEALR